MSLARLLTDTSLLSDHDIKELIEDGKLHIEPYDSAAVNQASVDLRLGSVLVQYPPQTIKIGVDRPQSCEIDISNSSYVLRPGEFVLGTTKEEVYIPDGYQGVIEAKGDIARAGIWVHNNDGHIDAGFHGHITLEIINCTEKTSLSNLLQIPQSASYLLVSSHLIATHYTMGSI